MTVREKRALKRNLSRWLEQGVELFDQAMKGLFELAVIATMGTGFMLYLWCCI